jgi:GAF domain-containing protein
MSFLGYLVSRYTTRRQNIQTHVDTEQLRALTEKLNRRDIVKHMQLDTFQKIAQIFHDLKGDDVYGEILTVILDITQSPYGAIGYLDTDNNWICPSMTRDIWDKCNIPDKNITFPFALWTKLNTWGKVWKTHKTIVSNKRVKIPEGHIDIKRIMIVPVLLGDTLIGMMAFANKPTNYNEEDIIVLEALSNYIAPILNSRLYQNGVYYDAE